MDATIDRRRDRSRARSMKRRSIYPPIVSIGLVAMLGATVLFAALGLVVSREFRFPCGSSIYGVGSRHYCVTFVYRELSPPDRGLEGVVASFGRVRANPDGCLDFTASRRESDWGPAVRWREYRTHLSIAGLTIETGAAASQARTAHGYSSVQRSTTDSWIVRVPLWMVALFTGVLLVWFSRGHIIIWNRRRLGLCLHCGYNISYSVGRCPECGYAMHEMGDPMERRPHNG